MPAIFRAGGMGEEKILPAAKKIRQPLRNKDKKFNFCFKIGWRARAAGEPEGRFSNWR